jgi:hypothetical protein
VELAARLVADLVHAGALLGAATDVDLTPLVESYLKRLEDPKRTSSARLSTATGRLQAAWFGEDGGAFAVGQGSGRLMSALWLAAHLIARRRVWGVRRLGICLRVETRWRWSRQ